MGFSVPARLLEQRWAFTPPFHPCLRTEARRRFIFCGTFRQSRFSRTARTYPVGKDRLRGIAPFGVRTFLLGLAPEAILHPSKTEVKKYGALWEFASEMPTDALQQQPNLFRDGKIHVGRVVEDSAAVDTTDEFLLCLTGDNGGAAQLHVAATANAVLNSNDNVLTLVFEKALVFGANGGIDGVGQLASIGVEGREFLF